MFTIFGVNGNTGSVVAKELLARGQKVRAVVRPGKSGAEWLKRGAQVVEADINDAGSVANALNGATAAYFLLPPDPTSEAFIERGRRLVDTFATALDQSPVPHVVLLSSVGTQHASGTGPIRTLHYAEQRFAQTKSRWTFLRPAYFMENIALNAALIRGQGLLPVFGGGESYKFPMVATDDIGLIATKALLEPPTDRRVIELAGPEEYSFEDAARELSEIVGRPVKATALPIEGMVGALTQAGLSQDMAELYREMTEGLAQGLVAFEGKVPLIRGQVTLRTLLERAFKS